MIRVRNIRTGIESSWSDRTYELNKQGMERGTIPYELITESPDVPTPISIEDFLSQKKTIVVKDVEDKAVEPEPIPEVETEPEVEPEVKQITPKRNANTKQKNRRNK